MMFNASCVDKEVRASLRALGITLRVCDLTVMIRYLLENDIIQPHQIYEIEAAIRSMVSD